MFPEIKIVRGTAKTFMGREVVGNKHEQVSGRVRGGEISV